LPAKHSANPSGPAHIVLGVAAAILVGLVGWVVVRAVGPHPPADRQATVVLPSMPQVPVGEAAPSPLPSASPSRSVSASPSRSPRATRPASAHSPSARRSPSRPAAAWSSAAAPPHLTAALSVRASWDSGYVAGVRIVNTGAKASTWSVTVNHSDVDGLRLVATWNAAGEQHGDRLVFSGGALAPGATADFGYQAGRTGGGAARPSGCSTVGGTCSVR
jgi:hypothetical protein